MAVQRTSSSVERKRSHNAVPAKQTAEVPRVRSFQDLEAWQVCRVVRQRMAVLARKLPAQERFRLADQIVRASRSATANLAEGYGRYQYPDMVRFARQARGSLYEVIDHLTVALDEGYLGDAHFEEESVNIHRAIQLVNGFIRYLRGRQEATQD